MNAESLVLNTLTSEAFVMVNKQLIRYFDGDGSAAIFLSELLSSYKYHLNNQTLEPDGGFAIPIRRYEIVLGYSSYKQDRILKLCIEKGLVSVYKKGFPKMRQVVIDFDTLARILSKDDQHDRKVEKAEFYSNLNEKLNDCPFTKSTILPVEEACDNIKPVLRGTLILISRYLSDHGKKVEWSSELVGRVKMWVNNRSRLKIFDYTIVTRTLDTMKVLGNTQFNEFIKDFIVTAKGVQDVHHFKQVTDYHDLID